MSRKGSTAAFIVEPARLPLAFNPASAVRAARGPDRWCAIGLGGLLLSGTSAHDLRTTFGDSTVLALLALMVLLLVAMLAAIVRLPPQETSRTDQDADSGMDFGSQWSPLADGGLPPALAWQARSAGPGEPSLPLRPQGQPGARGYAPRHSQAGDPDADRDTLGMPKVTGGPPWGPAPRPPGVW